MADIICHCCGNVFDSHAVACPRCERCPGCGRWRGNETGNCSSCGHVGDARALAELEARLDPRLPRNQRTVNWLSREWEIEELMGRLHFWKFLAVFIPVFLIWLFAWVGVRHALGLSGGWTNGLSMVLFLLGIRFVFLRLVWKGWFPWLLRERS